MKKAYKRTRMLYLQAIDDFGTDKSITMAIIIAAFMITTAIIYTMSGYWSIIDHKED